MIFDKVDLLSLDAGNTVIFLDHARLASIAQEAGFGVDPATLVKTEGVAKRALSGEGELVEVEWAQRDARGARGWGVMMATMFARAGVAERELPALLDRLWDEHVAFNLYSIVPKGFRETMRELRDRGVKVAIVSNSEGMLEPLFVELGLSGSVDALVDSAKVGVEKPDRRIFEIACERTGTTLDRTLHLGDTVATDLEGAKNAGARAMLIDPFGHYEGLYPAVPRAKGVIEVSREILRARR